MSQLTYEKMQDRLALFDPFVAIEISVVKMCVNAKRQMEKERHEQAMFKLQIEETEGMFRAYERATTKVKAFVP